MAMNEIDYGNSKLLREENAFDRALDFARVSRRESETNWNMYSGFNNGQWTKESVSSLMSQNRNTAQYNFIRGKVDNLAGAINKNDLDIDFIPVDVEYSDLTRVLKGLYYSDKELLDWGAEALQTVIDGLIHVGVEEMYISDKYNVLGNIGFRRLVPGSIIIDPHWKTHKTDEIKNVWKVAYLTPNELKEIYNRKGDRIDQMVARMAISGEEYSTQNNDSSSIPYYNLDEIYGTKYRVIEHHYIKETKKTVEIAIGTNGKIVLPEDISDEERDSVLAELGDASIIKHRKIVKEYWVTTTCRQLDKYEFLEHKKPEIQIGRLPFFPWSSARINGKDSGIVALLIDAQRSLNKRESLSDHIISNSAHGAMAVDPAMFGGDIAKTKAFINNLDKPNARAITASGALASGRRYTQLIEKTQYNGEIYQEIDRMSKYIQAISKSTATMEGGRESSHDTGRLFALRQMQSEIALTTLTRGYEQHWNDKGEAYMLMAQQLYSGAYREFNTNFGNVKGEKEVIQLNLSDDNKIPLSLKELPRHKVIVSQSPNGLTVRTTNMEINSELLASTPPELYLSRANIMRNIMGSLDSSEEDRARQKEASEIEYTSALERMKTDIANSQFSRDQMEQQKKQQQQQMQQQQQQMEMQQMGVPQQQGAEGQPQGTEGPPPQDASAEISQQQ